MMCDNVFKNIFSGTGRMSSSRPRLTARLMARRVASYVEVTGHHRIKPLNRFCVRKFPLPQHLRRWPAGARIQKTVLPGGKDATTPHTDRRPVRIDTRVAVVLFYKVQGNRLHSLTDRISMGSTPCSEVQASGTLFSAFSSVSGA